MKIVVGYKGGEADQKVLQLALAQAKANNASVEILQVTDLQPKNQAELAKQEAIEKDLKKAVSPVRKGKHRLQFHLESRTDPGRVSS